MKLELNCVPPTSNHIWKPRGNGKGNYLTDEGRSFKDLVAYMAAAKWKSLPSKKLFMFEVVLVFPDKRKRDVDNYHKILQDALEGVVYENDSQVIDLHITKMFGKEAKTTIKVQEIN